MRAGALVLADAVEAIRGAHEQRAAELAAREPVSRGTALDGAPSR